VQVPNGRRGQPLFQLLGVEVLHVVGYELDEADAADRRDQVQPHVLLIPAPCADTDRRLGGDQPRMEPVGHGLPLITSGGQPHVSVTQRSSEASASLGLGLGIKAFAAAVRQRDPRLPPAIHALTDGPFSRTYPNVDTPCLVSGSCCRAAGAPGPSGTRPALPAPQAVCLAADLPAR
jgi:hypothetical protein